MTGNDGDCARGDDDPSKHGGEHDLSVLLRVLQQLGVRLSLVGDVLNLIFFLIFFF